MKYLTMIMFFLSSMTFVNTLAWAESPDRSCVFHRTMTRAQFIKAEGYAPCRDLSNVDLSNLTFPKVNLKGAILKGTNLQGCDFGQTKATRANFNFAVMNNSKFDLFDARYSKFSDVEAKNTHFRRSFWTGAEMARFNAEKSLFESSYFVDAEMPEANFSGAEMVEVNFRSANLIDSNFGNSQIIKVEFNGSDLTGSDFSKSTVSNATFSKYGAASGALPEAVLDGVSMKDTSFICWCEFGENNWKNVNFMGSNYSSTLLPATMRSEAPKIGMKPNGHKDATQCP